MSHETGNSSTMSTPTARCRLCRDRVLGHLTYIRGYNEFILIVWIFLAHFFLFSSWNSSLKSLSFIQDLNKILPILLIGRVC